MAEAKLIPHPVFQWRSVHMFADGLFYDPEGVDGKVSIFA
jgi:hypothetical protein